MIEMTNEEIEERIKQLRELQKKIDLQATFEIGRIEGQIQILNELKTEVKDEQKES